MKQGIAVLSPEQKQRVADALEFVPDSDDAVALVERLNSGIELHQFVLNYNPNDGLLPLWSIVRNPICDRGTALCIYWLLADFALSREQFKGQTDPNWDGVGLIEEIEERYSSGFYTQHNVCYVPLDFLQWSQTRVKLIKHQNGGKLPFPEAMLAPSPGVIIAREEI